MKETGGPSARRCGEPARCEALSRNLALASKAACMGFVLLGACVPPAAACSRAEASRAGAPTALLGAASTENGPGASTGPITVRLSGQPVAFADDAPAGRLFVITQQLPGQDAPASSCSLSVLSTATGKLLASFTPVDPAVASMTGSGNHLHVTGEDFSNLAVDENGGRVFVLSDGLLTRSSGLVGPAYVFTLDATTGVELAATKLPGAGVPGPLVIDDASNRVFTNDGETNRMSVLDATTGKLLHTVTLPNTLPKFPEAVEPLGVDTRDHGVLVNAPNGMVLVDEHTGAILHAIPQPGGYAQAALVDGLRGRAVASVQTEAQDGTTISSIETVDLANGKVVGALLGGGPDAAIPLALDERTGQAMVLVDGEFNGQGDVSIVDDTTGQATSGDIPSGIGQDAASPSAAINPITGHGLFAQAAGSFQGPITLEVVDLSSGAQLAQVTINGETDYTAPSIAVDAPTRHVFVANPSENSVIMYDATKL